MKLSAVIGNEKKIKKAAAEKLGKVAIAVKKPDLFNGMVRTYQKKDETGEDFPQERKRVQIRANELLQQVREGYSDIFDINLTKDSANCLAKASVVVDGKELLKNVPVTFLLALSKELEEMKSVLLEPMPTLDSAESWDRDQSTGMFKSVGKKVQKTKKVQKPVVLYPATEKHPAQTQLIVEDEVVGYWDETKESGAIQETEKTQILARLQKLLLAVNAAAIKANSEIEADQAKVGETLCSYILG